MGIKQAVLEVCEELFDVDSSSLPVSGSHAQGLEKRGLGAGELAGRRSLNCEGMRAWFRDFWGSQLRIIALRLAVGSAHDAFLLLPPLSWSHRRCMEKRQCA